MKILSGRRAKSLEAAAALAFQDTVGLSVAGHLESPIVTLLRRSYFPPSFPKCVACLVIKVLHGPTLDGEGGRG